MKRIIKLLGLGVLVVTQISLSSAIAAVTTTTTYNDGDIIYSDDFENSTPTNNMTFNGTTVALNYVSVPGPNSMTSTCMKIPNVVAKSGIGAYAVFDFSIRHNTKYL